MEEIISTNFIEEIINEDLREGKHTEIITRFPPEPNGYLHIGHAKSLCINFGIKQKYQGKCNLRFDDTNPSKEDVEYVESIKKDIKWLGFNWDLELYASDYFGRMYECAVGLIKKGLAYVCDFSAEQIKETRGTLTEPGAESPYRNRSVEENLKLFEDMKNGVFADGEKVLRAKIDMASPNINMRDPIIYRILRATHHRTGDKWLIYPMYDFAHPLEDAFEGITHSICTLEFEDHRPLYDWVKINCGFVPGPRQIEFARLNIQRTIMSKRYLKKLVDEKFVEGWSDPRMPTLSGMRERGYPPEAIREFCNRIGVAKANSEVETSMLEYCVRENLNQSATRVMVVKNPIKLTITNFEGTEYENIENNQNIESAGVHKLSFSKNLLIDAEDFAIVPPPKYKRLVPDGLVRLRGGYIIKHTGHTVDDEGYVTEVFAELIPNSRSGQENAGMKVKGVIHWVNAEDAVECTLNDYDYLLTEGSGDFSLRMNKDSHKVIKAYAENYLKDAKPYERFQFVRTGYYSKNNKSGLNFNQIVSLKDSYKG
ncbi:MAG: glutamine--tRNA ligase/YqeY domain fusion protein [Clostridia bacterium]